MKFSIILNTRKRVGLLSNLFCSLAEKTNDISNLVVFVNYDDDDNETDEFFRSYIDGSFGNLFVSSFRVPRISNLHSGLNSLARLVQGDVVFVLNDDTEMLTTDWDLVATEVIEKNQKEDGIYYLRTSDTSIDKPDGRIYSSFPMISKKAVDAAGIFMIEDFVGLGGDSSIYRVYEAVDRIIDCSDVVIDHLTHNTIKAVTTPDTTAAEMREQTKNNYVDPFICDINSYVDKLKKAINES